MSVPVQLEQCLPFHLQLHLRILFENLRVPLPQELRNKFVGNSASAQPRGIGRSQIVDPKVWHSSATQRGAPGGLERLLMSIRVFCAGEHERPRSRDFQLAPERFRRNIGQRGPQQRRSLLWSPESTLCR